MKVIIVDDERNAREYLEIELKKITAITAVELFANPHNALNYAAENSIDAAFVDIEMPGINGLEMAMRLKKINPKTNIIFVTGHSKYALDAFKTNASDYLLKPATAESIQNALENLRYPVKQPNSRQCARVRIQTFGNFEVFVDGKPLQITLSKPKEILAYLVNKRGTSVSTAEIASVLWENRVYDRSLQSQTRSAISQLMKILKNASIQDIIIKSWNNIAVDTGKFDCDYYQFLEGNMASVNSYAGEYMNEYSWAEMTAGLLYQKKIQP